MMPTAGSPDQKPDRRGLALGLALLLLAMAIGFAYYGPHRHLGTQLLEEGGKHGLLFEGGTRRGGPLSTTLLDVRVSLRGNPHLAIEIGRLRIRHWPFTTPRVSVEGINVHLKGDPIVHFETAIEAWSSPQAQLDVRPLELTYEHRLLGTLHLGGVEIARHGNLLAMNVAQVRLGDSLWREVKLSFERHRDALVVGFGDASSPNGPQLTCFPPQAGTSRWLLDLPHQPIRPLLKRLGLAMGDEFTSTKVAGSISLDIPDDVARQVHGRIQMVADDWPLFAPGVAEPMLGRTLSLLSNVVGSADGSSWELPRVELTMSVFSLAGKGRLQLGGAKRLLLEAAGDRTCRELRRFLPPSPLLDTVRRFLDKTESTRATKDGEPRARLEVRWDTNTAPGPFRPTWRFVPGCGLDPWPEEG